MTFRRTTLPATKDAYAEVCCTSCAQPLTHVIEPSADPSAPWPDLQADSALRIELHGGFGMYFDPLGITPDENDALSILLCSSCADTLCTTFPYFARAIAPLT